MKTPQLCDEEDDIQFTTASAFKLCNELQSSTPQFVSTV